MKMKIAIFGSSVNEHAQKVAKEIKALGKVLAGKKVIIITGACTGIPYQVALAAYQKNKTEIWGFSPTRNFAEQVASTPEDDNSIYSKLIYIPKNYEFADNIDIARKYRNVTSTAMTDAGIIVGGRWGTMNEFTNLYDMGKVIGILTNTGGVADLLKTLNQKISKPNKAVLIFSSSPKDLIDKVLKEVKRKKHRQNLTYEVDKKSFNKRQY